MPENNSETEKKAYTVFNAGELTCQTDVDGLKFDFNYGARVLNARALSAPGRWKKQSTA